MESQFVDMITPLTIEEKFSLADTDADGFVDSTEAVNAREDWAVRRFDSIDTDVLSNTELDAYQSEKQAEQFVRRDCIKQQFSL